MNDRNRGMNASLLLPMAALGASVVYGAVLVGFGVNDVEPLQLIQDAGDDDSRPLYAGLLSHVGVFGWVATAAIALFAASMRFGLDGSSRNVAGLLLCGGVLSALLGIDDFFLLHDRVIPQKIAYGTYALLGLTIVGFYPRLLLDTGGIGVLLAGTLLAASIGVDLVQHRLPGGYVAVQVVEEGLKFAGIACWLTAWSTVAAHALRTLPTAKRSAVPAV